MVDDRKSHAEESGTFATGYQSVKCACSYCVKNLHQETYPQYLMKPLCRVLIS